MKSYQQTIQYLYNLQYRGIKLGLKNIGHLLDYLGNPQEKFPAIHIAGTNGKGSTAAFIYSILKSAGYRVGLYTSPHLVDFTERIRVDDKLISWKTVVEYTRTLRPIIDKIRPTFFEATTAIAFRYFAEKQVDIVVVETGLGGRLDATNLVRAILTIITPIGYDHQQFLGKHIDQITAEKAGIIKRGIPCLTNNSLPEILEVIKQRCKVKNAPFLVLKEEAIQNIREELTGSCFTLDFGSISFQDLNIRMPGLHQIKNAALSAFAICHLPDFKVDEKDIRNGLAKAFWPGRLEIIKQCPLVILDVAHNPQGFECVFDFLRRHVRGQRIFTLIGLSKDKDFQKIADITSRNTNFVGIIKNFSEKALSASYLEKAFSTMPETPVIFEDIAKGYEYFVSRMRLNDVLLIIGSHYLAGEFLKKYKIVDFNKY